MADPPPDILAEHGHGFFAVGDCNKAWPVAEFRARDEKGDFRRSGGANMSGPAPDEISGQRAARMQQTKSLPDGSVRLRVEDRRAGQGGQGGGGLLDGGDELAGGP